MVLGLIFPIFQLVFYMFMVVSFISFFREKGKGVIIPQRKFIPLKVFLFYFIFALCLPLLVAYFRVPLDGTKASIYSVILALLVGVGLGIREKFRNVSTTKCAETAQHNVD